MKRDKQHPAPQPSPMLEDPFRPELSELALWVEPVKMSRTLEQKLVTL